MCLNHRQVEVNKNITELNCKSSTVDVVSAIDSGWALVAGILPMIVRVDGLTSSHSRLTTSIWDHNFSARVACQAACLSQTTQCPIISYHWDIARLMNDIKWCIVVVLQYWKASKYHDMISKNKKIWYDMSWHVKYVNRPSSSGSYPLSLVKPPYFKA